MAQPNDDAETGRIAGLGAGALAGAQLGTVFIPIPFIGTVTGAVVGGAVGSKLGQRIAPTLVNTFNQAVGALQPKPSATPAQPANPVSSIPISREGQDDTSNVLLAQLEQLGKLHAQGVLTDQEFSAAKARLLNS